MVTDKICSNVCREASSWSRFLTMATRTYTVMAIQIWVFTALSHVP